MTQGQFLRYHPPEREPNDVDPGKTERADHLCRVIRHILDEGARNTGRRRAAPIIVQDHLAARCQSVGHDRIPMIHATAKMLKEEERRLSRIGFAPATIGEAVAFHLDDAGRCSKMRMCHDVLLM